MSTDRNARWTVPQLRQGFHQFNKALRALAPSIASVLRGSSPTSSDPPTMTPRDDKTSRYDVNQTPRAAPERRQSLRHRLRDAPGLLEWCEGNEQIDCRNQDDRYQWRGAAVLADRGPPLDQPVRIRLSSGALGSEPVEARVVSTATDPSGIPVVRMQFAPRDIIG